MTEQDQFKQMQQFKQLQQQLTALEQRFDTRIEQTLGIKVWQSGREYIRNDIVYSEETRKLYFCLYNHRDQNPAYYIPGFGYQNLNAGRYWLTYPMEINTIKMLYLSQKQLSAFLVDEDINILDDHIIVGNGITPAEGDETAPELYEFSSIPLQWHICNNPEFELDWKQVDDCPTSAGKQTRWFPNLSFDRTGRYPRMIHQDMTTALESRAHGVEESLKMGLPRIQGHIGRINAYSNYLNPNQVFYKDGEEDHHMGIRHSDDRDQSMGISIDSHRVSANKNTTTITAGNVAERTRGDERDFYTLIKVR